MKKSILFIRIFILCLFIFQSPNAFCKDSYLKKGMEEYKKENYEEAIALLIKARKARPESSVTAFMLGMCYKKTMEYEKALPYFKDAVSLEPRIKDAVVELAYIYFQTGKIKEAEKWVHLAEKEEIFPAKTAFLKGLILQKNKKYAGAIKAFEKAESLDPGLSQSCEYNIALCYIAQKKFVLAKDKLNAAIQFNPDTDLSTFARRYQEILEKKIEMEKPIRLTFAVFGQYDTNVVLKPGGSALQSNITDEESLALVTNIRVDYLPKIEGPWLFNAQYAYYGRLHQNYSTSHDFIANSFYMAPGYNLGKFTVNLATRFTHTLLRDPSYKDYLSDFSIGPMIRAFLFKNNILEIFTGYRQKEYVQPSLTDDEDRDSKGFNSYLSWIWFFRPSSMLNFRYAFALEDTNGQNWDNLGHRFSLTASMPVIDKIKFQVTGDVYLQDFDNIHSVFNKKRRDRTYQISAGLTWEFLKNILLIGQYNRTWAYSNIYIYDYTRDIFSLGIEITF